MSANFYELLKYAATGIASPDMTYFDRMRASTLMGGAVQTLTGQPPLSFKADGSPLISWSMKGNGQQTGTPTPDNPVTPTFCGVRTANLLDYTTVESTSNATATQIPGGISVSGRYYVRFITVNFTVGNTYTMSWKANTTSGTSAPAWRFHYSDNTYSSMPSSGAPLIAEKEVTEILLYVSTSESCVVDFTEIMLNTGSTALPYEPFGYKIPITCAGQTTPVYLGQVSTVRKIRKLVLTGKENWYEGSSNYYIFINVSGKGEGIPNSTALCTHTESWVVVNNNGTALFFKKSVFVHTSAADFKSYLAAQYAAGTPVTVWYVLATPTTGIVNEPLCKIGDYADELHSTDAGVTIPTTKGQNTLTVETELQPSEMTITYKE